jgi:hypothetical protein
MPKTVRIEDIEGMRRREGIDDVELREEISDLHVGDVVRVTLLADAVSPVKETVTVRITRIDDRSFQGKLTVQPVLKELSHFQVGFLVAFTPSHIHSLAKKAAQKK